MYVSSPCTANEGPVRIQYKCLAPIYIFPEMNLLIFKKNYCAAYIGIGGMKIENEPRH